MAENEQLHAVIRILQKYSARPPLKFSSAAEVPEIARKILDATYLPKSLWTKWDKNREELIGRAVDVWVPLVDLLTALNMLPGEKLTATDVEQRLNALRYENSGYSRGPSEEIKEISLDAYTEEKAKGTEFIAILGWMEEWTADAEERLRQQQKVKRRDAIALEKQRAEARLRSGADCGWTVVDGVVDTHCRRNGRLFRLKALPKYASPNSPKLELIEVKTLDDKRGTLIGQYHTRGDAAKALLEVAYKPGWS